MKKKTFLLTNGFIIFLMSGIIYICMEVVFTSLLTDETIKKYEFKETLGTLSEKEIEKASLIGFSSGWMLIIGGISGLSLFGIYKLINKRFNIFFATLLGTIIINIIEFTSGVILNLNFKLNIWDYSNQYFNLLGQICLSQSMIYLFFICPISFWFFGFLESQYKTDEKKSFTLLIVYKNLVNPRALNIERMGKNYSSIK
ncbi:MAG TPA: hypothetical protein PLG34_08195 [Spirochaetota bacterium]|nr:hypothetical protein [Spirochaetota bacterium]HQB60123.1 hypothetical protein [Spirochaetota bacterium]